MTLTKNTDQPPYFCPTFFRPSNRAGIDEYPFHYREGTRAVTYRCSTMVGGKENEMMIVYEEDEQAPAGMAPTQGKGQFFVRIPFTRGTVKVILDVHDAAGVLTDMASRYSQDEYHQMGSSSAVPCIPFVSLTDKILREVIPADQYSKGINTDVMFKPRHE